MTRAEALVLLIWCVPLAARLAKEGTATELTREDKITLNGFGRVQQAGWLQNPIIYRLTGLSRADIEALTSKLDMANVAPGPGNSQQAEAAAPEPTAAGQATRKATLLETREFKEAKALFTAERFGEVLEKLYPLAAANPANTEIQTLLNQSLRANRAPSKLIIASETLPEKPARLAQRLALLLKGKGRGKDDGNDTTRSLTSTPQH